MSSAGSACHQVPKAPGQPNAPSEPRAHPGLLLRVGDHRDAEAEALAQPEGDAHERNLPLGLAEPVGGHHLDGFGLHQAYAVDLALAQHHAGELQVVVGRGDQAAAAGFKGRLAVRVRGNETSCSRSVSGSIGRAWPSGRASRAGTRNRCPACPAGRRCGPSAPGPGLALDAGDQEAQHLGGVAVVEALAGRIAQRQARPGPSTRRPASAACRAAGPACPRGPGRSDPRR